MIFLLSDCQLIVATSARPRGLYLPGFDADECAKFIHKQADNTEVALVFGRERSGLTNEELLCCHYHLLIPCNPQYSSLNLAQAVQIVLYELRKQLIQGQGKITHNHEPLASFEDVERLYAHLSKFLLDINFLKLKNPARVMPRIRRMLNRIRFEQMEVNILRGILSHLQKSLICED